MFEVKTYPLGYCEEKELPENLTFPKSSKVFFETVLESIKKK